MMKKMGLALFGLVVAFALAAPQKADAQVSVGIGVGLPGYVVVQRPYYSAPAYYGGYAYAAPVYGGGWYGYRDYRHEGWRDDRRYEGYRHEGRYEDRRHDGYRDEGRRDDHRHDNYRDDRHDGRR